MKKYITQGDAAQQFFALYIAFNIAIKTLEFSCKFDVIIRRLLGFETALKTRA